VVGLFEFSNYVLFIFLLPIWGSLSCFLQKGPLFGVKKGAVLPLSSVFFNPLDWLMNSEFNLVVHKFSGAADLDPICRLLVGQLQKL